MLARHTVHAISRSPPPPPFICFPSPPRSFGHTRDVRLVREGGGLHHPDTGVDLWHHLKVWRDDDDRILGAFKVNAFSDTYEPPDGFPIFNTPDGKLPAELLEDPSVVFDQFSPSNWADLPAFRNTIHRMAERAPSVVTAEKEARVLFKRDTCLTDSPAHEPASATTTLPPLIPAGSPLAKLFTGAVGRRPRRVREGRTRKPCRLRHGQAPRGEEEGGLVGALAQQLTKSPLSSAQFLWSLQWSRRAHPPAPP